MTYVPQKRAQIPQEDRAFCLISIEADPRFGLSELSFPDGVFVEAMEYKNGVNRNWVASITIFDPTFDAVEVALAMLKEGGKVRIQYGWMSSSLGPLFAYDQARVLNGTLSDFESEYTLEGMRITLHVIALQVIAGVALKNDEIEDFYTPQRILKSVVEKQERPAPGPGGGTILVQVTTQKSVPVPPRLWCNGSRARIVGRFPQADNLTLLTDQDVVVEVAIRSGLKLFNKDGKLTVEETTNGPRSLTDSTLIDPGMDVLLRRHGGESVINYLRRVAPVCRSSLYPDDADNAFQVYIEEDRGNKILHFHTPRFAVETGIVKAAKKKFTVNRQPPREEAAAGYRRPEWGMSLDFQVDSLGLRAARLGGYGALVQGRDRDTGKQLSLRNAPPGTNALRVGTGFRSGFFQDAVVQLSSDLEPEEVEALANSRRALFTFPLKVTMRVLGLPEIDVFDVVWVDVRTAANSPHWSSGYYMVLGFDHAISASGGFETTLEMVRDNMASAVSSRNGFEPVEGRVYDAAKGISAYNRELLQPLIPSLKGAAQQVLLIDPVRGESVRASRLESQKVLLEAALRQQHTNIVTPRVPRIPVCMSSETSATLEQQVRQVGNE